MADPTIRGGCLCGAVRYRAAGVPTASMICHCRSCAHAAGAPAVAWITVEADRFAWEAGTPAAFHSTPPVTRTFCPACGTSLTYAETARPHQIDVTTATLDDDHQAFPRPTTRWLHDGPGWLPFGFDGLPAYEAKARPEGTAALHFSSLPNIVWSEAPGPRPRYGSPGCARNQRAHAPLKGGFPVGRMPAPTNRRVQTRAACQALWSIPRSAPVRSPTGRSRREDARIAAADRHPHPRRPLLRARPREGLRRAHRHAPGVGGAVRRPPRRRRRVLIVGDLRIACSTRRGTRTTR